MPVLILLLALMLAPSAVLAEAPPLRTDHLNSRLVAEQSAVVPGQALRLGLWLQHDPGWHTYWLNPGDSGLPTRIDLELPAGFEAGPIQWPIPERLPAGPLVNFGYSDTVVLPLTVRVPDSLEGGHLTLRARADWLVCEVECIPGDGEYELTLPVSEAAVPDPRWAADFARADRRQPQPAPAAAGLGFTDQTVELRLPAELDETPDARWAFFPLGAQVVSNAAEPVWVEADGRRALVLPKSDYFVGAPESFEFLLARGDTGLLFTATPLALVAGGPAVQEGATAPGLVVALGLALLGGLILNLMPCVFPVLFLKARAAIEAADDRALLRRHGLFYTAGVVLSFIGVAAVLLALRASGEALGWGFQLQSPAFVAALALLFFVLAMNFAGLFEFGGAGLAGAGQRLVTGRGDRAAFFTGVLACLVASPCTAPFMGVALGVALALPAPSALAIFAVLGLGLALPILALGWIPGLARLLPRPGPWMETFRRLLAFPLLLTVAWLLWVYGEQTSALAMSWLLAALVGVAFGLWLLGFGGGWRLAGYAALAAFIALPLWRAPEISAPSTAGEQAIHQAWTPALLDDLLAVGEPVLVNMTAAWCITCLANERVALSTPAVQRALRDRGVHYLKGDWTRRDSDITAYLESFGRSGVPLYVLYPGGGREPVVLPQLLTVEIMERALEAI
jgi:DsbC/DsbD-like thiol-disulfide interchange protein/cytochrome c biogenesis protein CcdA